MAEQNIKLIAQNKKARHDFFIEQTFEAGIELKGTEVKSVRQGKVNLKDSYAEVKNGELLLYNMHISPYENANMFNVDSKRTRRLLLHRYEINRLTGAVNQKGYSIVPLKVYLKGSLVKIEIALAKGKKVYDKRADIAKKDAKRQMARAIKEKNQY